MNIKRIIGMLLTVTFIIAMFWFIASYIDVVTHNLDEDPIYHGWNFFKLLVENLYKENGEGKNSLFVYCIFLDVTRLK